MARGTLPLDRNSEGAPTEADAPPSTMGSGLPETVLRFRIDGPLGAGGMADILRAYDPVLERPVALKVLRTKLADDRRRRTLREARAAAALSHPNVITIYEVDEAEGVVVIAMELLEGRVLRGAMAEPTSLATKLRWLLEMARALEAAHARGLVHRDVKPDNAFVCANGTLKLLDFGIAKRQAEDVYVDEETGPSSMSTTEGRRIGTPRYMAPEQLLGAGTDARTDQHAWALVAFEVLTGRHAAAEIATVPDGLAAAGPRSSAGGERRAHLARVPGLPEAVVAAIVRALAPSKEGRFPSMAPLVDLLEGALHDIATATATPARALAAPARALAPPLTLRRGPFLVAAFSVALGVAMIAALGTTVVLLRRRRALHEPAKVAAEPVAPPFCRVEGVRTYPDASKVTAFTVFPGSGEMGAYLAGESADRAFLRERGGKLEPWAPLGELGGADGALVGGVYRGDRVFAAAFHPPASSAVALWSERRAAGSASTGAEPAPLHFAVYPFFLGRPAVVEAYGNLFAIFGGAVAPGVNGAKELSGLYGTFAAEDTRPRPSFTLHPGQQFDLPSAAGASDRLAATFSGWRGLYLQQFDRLGNSLGPLVTIDTAAPTPGASGDDAFLLLSALVLQGSTMRVYWVDRREPAHVFTATLASSGTAFEARRAVVTEAIAPRQPLAARLPDGRPVLVWAASLVGNTILRLAPIRPNGDLETATEIARGTFRELSAVSTAAGVTVGWMDEAATLHAITVRCAATRR